MSLKSFKNLFTFLLLLFICFINAQDNEVAKLIREGNHEIFKNPVRAKEIATKLYEESGDNIPEKFNALLIMAQADVLLAKYDSSLQYAMEAKDLSEKMADESYKLRIYAYLGYHFHQLDVKEKALDYIDKAEKITRNYTFPDSLTYLKGNIFFTKALMYQTELDCEYAINYFKKAIKAYYESIENEYAKNNLGLAYSQKGYCELELNKLEEAEKSFEFAVANSENNQDQRYNIFAKIGLARVDALRGNYTKSNKILKRELLRAEELHIKHLQNDIYKFLSYNYLKLKDTKNYEFYNELYKKSQSEFSKTEASSINHIINKASQNKKENIDSSRYLSIGVLVIILITLGIFYILFRIKNMKQKMKNDQK